MAAVAFSYFETLAQLGDPNRILEEHCRLQSLNNLLNRVGFEQHLYQDYVETTFTLLRELAALVSLPTAASPASARSKVWEQFKDPAVANAVIAHVRVRRLSQARGGCRRICEPC